MAGSVADVKGKTLMKGAHSAPPLSTLKMDNHGKDLAEDSRKQTTASGLRKELESVAEVNSAAKTCPNFSFLSLSELGLKVS